MQYKIKTDHFDVEKDDKYIIAQLSACYGDKIYIAKGTIKVTKENL